MKKILVITGLGLVVLLVIGVLTMSYFLDSAIKQGVETFGPKLTQVSIKLDKVSLSLLSGSGSIHGFLVGNPEGFKTPQAISVGSASLALKPSSLLSDKIVITSIKVDAPEITLEIGLDGNNLSKILANIEAATGGGGTNVTPAPAEKSPAKKLQVDEFIVSGAKLQVSIVGMGGKTIALSLPTLSLNDLGQGPDGVTGAELTKLVLAKIEQAALKAASESNYDVSKITKDLTKDLGKGATNAAEKLSQSIGDLFKKKK